MGFVSPAGSVGVKRSPLATNAPTSNICPASHSADGQIYGKVYQFPMLAPKLIKYGKEGKRMDWELEIKDSGYLPEKGKPK